MASAKNVLNELGYKSPGHFIFKMPAIPVPQNLQGKGATGREYGKKVGEAIASQIISVVKSAMNKGGAMPRNWVSFGDDFGGMQYKYGAGAMKGAGLFGSLGGMLGSAAGNSLGGLFGFGEKGQCCSSKRNLKGAGFFDAIVDGFKAIPTAFGQIQPGISGVLNNTKEVTDRIGVLAGLADKAAQLPGKLAPFKGLFGFGMPKKMVVGRGGSQKIQIPKVYVDLAGRGNIEGIARQIAGELGGYLGNHAENILQGVGSRTLPGRVNPRKIRNVRRVEDLDEVKEDMADINIKPVRRRPVEAPRILPVVQEPGGGRKKAGAAKKPTRKKASASKKARGAGLMLTSA